MEIIIASSNKDKIKEFKNLLGDKIEVKSKKDVGLGDLEVIEDGETLNENSYKKASAINLKTGKFTISDDTGLFVNALSGRPGVHAHRYASENPTYKENRDKLLEELENSKDRSAYFMTVICFIDENKKAHYFEGKIEGNIANKDLGDKEFGYDQIFVPKDSEKSFGQMTIEEKNSYSHRARAIEKFKNFLKEKKYI